jgi:hypothetical protein
MRSRALRRQFIPILGFVLTLGSTHLWSVDIKPEEVLAKHLDAIGSAQARSRMKSRAIQGGTTYHVLVGGSGAVDGKFQFASERPKSDFLFRINANGFQGEQFIYDGSRTSVAGTYADHTRSEFGNFVLTQDLILRENLLGGVWSTGWPLLDLEGHKAKLHVEGIKKIDGKELLAVRYEPKKKTDMEIFLYFDPQSYQHVMTIYKTEPSTSVVGGEIVMAEKQTRRYRIEERFSDFKTADGLTLPNHYDVRYTFEGESGFTKSIEWEVTALSISNNVSIDPRAFQIK